MAANKFIFTLTTLVLLLHIIVPLLASCSQAPRQVYIVYFGEHKGDKALHEIEETHRSYLYSLKESKEEADSSLLYSYKHGFNGFAAVLTPEEASKLSGVDGVVSVSKSGPGKYALHTTRSWEFVGLEENGKRIHKHDGSSEGGDDLLLKARYGRDVIVGVLDSGVWPESNSFRDEGMGPVPKSWKGICQTGDNFTSSHCNKKLIGARYYIKGYENYYGSLNTTIDYRSPRDKDGHGTHTSSTAAGRTVPDAAALGGFASGTASGGAPLAKLAIYKVCWPVPGSSKANGNTCFEEDMLAAMDDAIGDGVHVISISIGTTKPVNYTDDGISIGALHAVKRNIVVACSAGNNGPNPATLANPAPWIITVAASTVDRSFSSPVVLGNLLRIEGETVTPSKLENKMYPLVYAGDVVLPGVSSDVVGQCLPNSLSPAKAKGKIVFCMRGNGTRIGKGQEVKRAGGAGYILGNGPLNGAEMTADPHVLPATGVSYADGIRILNYIKSTKTPMATIIPAKTVLHTKPAPQMAAFSSRGPNIIDLNILKPDITAPGVNILAAWSEEDAPTKLTEDHRRVKYNIESGTSMSCPHVAGAAALVKAVHPDWSSAAIRSALMTTAGLLNNVGKPMGDAFGKLANSFQYGAGHLRPAKAADPGLVYDASGYDYSIYLCSLGLKALNSTVPCPNNSLPTNMLNYPSLAIHQLTGMVTIRRTVTNVGGNGKSVYFSSVKPPLGIQVKVFPSILVFNRVGQKKSFTITVRANRDMVGATPKDEYAFGWYTWTDGVHVVRSPMAVSLA